MLKIIRNITLGVLVCFPFVLCAMDSADAKKDTSNKKEDVYVAFRKAIGNSIKADQQAHAQALALQNQMKQKDQQAKKEFKEQWGIFAAIANSPTPALPSACVVRTHQIFNAFNALPGLAKKMAFEDRKVFFGMIKQGCTTGAQLEAYKPLLNALLPAQRKLFAQTSLS